MMKIFPFIRQHDAMQCGAACLNMVCRYYGVSYSFDALSEICCPANDGISLYGLSQGAKDIGFDTYLCKISINNLSNNITPCILHWDQNHYVVLYKIKKGKYYIADPGKGKYKIDAAELRRHWIVTKNDDEEKGVALLLEPTEAFGVKKIKLKSKKRSLSLLMGYLAKYKKYLIHVFIGLLISCILQLIFPFLTQAIVDIGIHHNNIGFIWLILIGELMIVIGRMSTDFIRRWILLHISMRINVSLVNDFFIKLLKLPMSFFETKMIGDLLQRLEDHGRVESFLTNQVLNVLFTFLSLIVFGTVLFIYSKMVFGVFAIGSIIYVLWCTFFLQKRRYLDYELFARQAVNHSMIYQFITSMQEIKLQGCEMRRRKEWEDSQARLFNNQLESLKLQQNQESGAIFIKEIKDILITVLAATSVIQGSITLGGMLAIQYIIGQLNSPLDQFMSFIYTLQDVRISLERINEIHNKDNEEYGNMQFKSYLGDNGIGIRNVEFKYNKYADKNTLENINIDIPLGKITAIVGASGSGKTTLLKLILGYYIVNNGTIEIGGRNIKDYDFEWWRMQCGVVMQDGVIFSESIARNIAVSDDDINLERLEQAARIACIHKDIMKLPLKYNTKIGCDGVGLSQGQKQRILIARAVYKNPNYIILDEATNSLDAKNEKEIIRNLDEFYKGRTVIVVAHRLSTVKNADQIIVLNEGRVVETGTHGELTNKKGYYYELVKNQLELGC